VLRPLTEHPGRWARIRHYKGDSQAGTTAKQLREKKLTVPLGYWDAVGRRSDGRGSGSDLYVRYLGSTKAEAERLRAAS
jgi:hypothetical protein